MDNSIINEYYRIIKNKISHSNFDSAMGSIDKLLTNFPQNSQGYYYKGVCNFAMEKYEDSIASYMMSLSIDPAFAKAHFNLGVAYYILNNYDEALIHIAKALVIFSNLKELDCRARCVAAIKLIESERKTFI